MTKLNIRLIWSCKAVTDLLFLWAESAVRFSPEIADTRLRELKMSADRLIEQPLRGRAREKLQPGIRALVTYPTALFYRVSGSAVEVVRVIDGQQDLPSIFRANE
jgi:toxin ParE1/3/4